jgi:hypothetical protein
MKSVASRLVCGISRLNTAVLAEISTGTVILIHLLATAETAKIANIESEDTFLQLDEKHFTIDGQNFEFYIEAQTTLRRRSSMSST